MLYTSVYGNFCEPFWECPGFLDWKIGISGAMLYMQTTSTNKPWGGECRWIQLGIEWGMSRLKVGDYKSIGIRCSLEFGGLWNASCSSLELSQARRHREPLHWSELGLWLKQHEPGNVSGNAKSEVFLIIYLFMKCKQQHWKERDISLTQISCVAKYTAKEALLIILHETYLGFVYSLIRWVSLCFLSRAGAISFQNKGPFVCFLFVCFINLLLSIWVVLLHRQEVFPTFRKRK